MRPSRPVRGFVRIAGCLGAAIGGLYALFGLMGYGLRLLVPVLLVVFVLLMRPLLVLWSRTSLGADRIAVRRLPAGWIEVPCSAVGFVGTRRGLLLEWPVLYLRDGSVVELGAPARFWFRADAEFERGLGALLALAGRGEPRPYTRWSLSRVIAGPLLVVVAAGLVLIDPPWASDAWPLRQHARHLPDTCRMFDARAQRLLPGAVLDHTFSRNDDSDPHVKRHMCQWNATRPGEGGTPLPDVGRLSIVLELDHGIGPVSDATEAHRAFVRETHIGAGETGVKVPRTGDEAELITEPPGAGFVWVTVATRRANVEEKVDLIYKGRQREHEAAETAEALARLGLSEIRFG